MHFLMHCKMHWALLVVIFALNQSFWVGAQVASPCGDWIAYQDEKCYKILDDTARTFDDAKNACAKLELEHNTPTPPIIRTKEEQEFLTNFLFKTSKKMTNFWIGSHLSGTAFKWIDLTDLAYSNWATGSPKNQTVNACAQMQADASSQGKWIEESCEKKNTVVCQKLQTWSFSHLQNAFLEVRRGLRVSQDNEKKNADLKQNLDEANKKIVELKQTLDAANSASTKNLTDLKQTLDSSSKTITELKQTLDAANAASSKNLADMKQTVDSSSKTITELKQSLDEANKKIADQSTSIASASSTSTSNYNSIRNLIPVGFIYTQLPYGKAPSDIFPYYMTWEDVSHEYAGYFFRVNGGDAGSYETVQGDQAPRIYAISRSKSGFDDDTTSYSLSPGSSSGWIYTGDSALHGYYHYTNQYNFYTSSGEVRPKSMATRVWKRTA